MSAELTPAWRRYLGTFEALCRLGFKADDIYSNFDNALGNDGPSLYILVRRSSRRDDHFQIRMGVQDQATYTADYRAMTKLWNDPSQKALHKEVYQEWLSEVGAWSLLSLLLEHDIPIPNRHAVATSLVSDDTVH